MYDMDKKERKIWNENMFIGQQEFKKIHKKMFVNKVLELYLLQDCGEGQKASQDQSLKERRQVSL